MYDGLGPKAFVFKSVYQLHVEFYLIVLKILQTWKWEKTPFFYIQKEGQDLYAWRRVTAQSQSVCFARSSNKVNSWHLQFKSSSMVSGMKDPSLSPGRAIAGPNLDGPMVWFHPSVLSLFLCHCNSFLMSTIQMKGLESYTNGQVSLRTMKNFVQKCYAMMSKWPSWSKGGRYCNYLMSLSLITSMTGQATFFLLK